MRRLYATRSIAEVGTESLQLVRRLDPPLGGNEEVALRRRGQLFGVPVAIGRRAGFGRDRRHVPSSRNARCRPSRRPRSSSTPAHSPHNLDTMTRRAARRTAATARQGAQVHGARAASRPCAGTAASRARRRARSSVWRSAGLGDDLLLANETRRRRSDRARWPTSGARVTVAVDSRSDRRRRGRATASARCWSTSTSACRAAAAARRTRARIADLAPHARARGARRHGLRGTRRSGSRIAAERDAKTAEAMDEARGGARGGRRRRRLGRRDRHVRHQHRRDRDPGRLVRVDGHRVRRARAPVRARARDRRDGRSTSARSTRSPTAG